MIVEYEIKSAWNENSISSNSLIAPSMSGMFAYISRAQLYVMIIPGSSLKFLIYLKKSSALMYSFYLKYPLIMVVNTIEFWLKKWSFIDKYNSKAKSILLFLMQHSRTKP